MMMGTRSGLGRRIFDDALLYRTDDLYAAIIVTGLLGYAANAIVLRIQRKLIHWGGQQ